jgi:hypothetical protein
MNGVAYSISLLLSELPWKMSELLLLLSEFCQTFLLFVFGVSASLSSVRFSTYSSVLDYCAMLVSSMAN